MAGVRDLAYKATLATWTDGGRKRGNTDRDRGNTDRIRNGSASDTEGHRHGLGAGGCRGIMRRSTTAWGTMRRPGDRTTRGGRRLAGQSEIPTDVDVGGRRGGSDVYLDRDDGDGIFDCDAAFGVSGLDRIGAGLGWGEGGDLLVGRREGSRCGIIPVQRCCPGQGAASASADRACER